MDLLLVLLHLLLVIIWILQSPWHSWSAWQIRGRGFEPLLMRYIFSGKYLSAIQVSCYIMQ